MTDNTATTTTAAPQPRKRLPQDIDVPAPETALAEVSQGEPLAPVSSPTPAANVPEAAPVLAGEGVAAAPPPVASAAWGLTGGLLATSVGAFAAQRSTHSPDPVAVTITDDTSGTAFDTVRFTLAFERPVSGFTVDDVVVTNGRLGTFEAIDDRHYRISVSPTLNTPGDMTINVVEGAAHAADGGGNAATTASQRTGVTLDLVGLQVADKPYDGTTTAEVTSPGSLRGVATGDEVQLRAGTVAFADPHAGENKTVSLSELALTGPDASDYRLPAQIPSTADISPAPLYVSGLTLTLGPTAGAAEYAGGDLFVDGELGKNDVLSVVPFAGNTARQVLRISHADGQLATGDYEMIPVAVGGDLAAFTPLLSVGQTATPVGPTSGRLTLQGVTIADKVYDGTTKAAISSLGVLNGVAPDDAVMVLPGEAFFADKIPGAGKPVQIDGLQLTGPDAASYSLVDGEQLAVGTITPRQLHVSSFDANKVYDGTTIGSISLGDPVNDIPVGTFADFNPSASKPVTLSGLLLADQVGANYSIGVGGRLTSVANSISLTYEGFESTTVTNHHSAGGGSIELIGDAVGAVNLGQPASGQGGVTLTNASSASNTSGIYTTDTPRTGAVPSYQTLLAADSTTSTPATSATAATLSVDSSLPPWLNGWVEPMGS